jgi:hypothetical protein
LFEIGNYNLCAAGFIASKVMPLKAGFRKAETSEPPVPPAGQHKTIMYGVLTNIRAASH